MAREILTGNNSPERRFVYPNDPVGYEFRPGATSLKEGDVLDDFIKGFPKFLQEEASTNNQQSERARELLDAVDELPDGHLDMAIRLSTRGLESEAGISDVETLFDVLEKLDKVLDPEQEKDSRYAAEHIKNLLENDNLDTRHRRLWYQFIWGDLANKYVKEREAMDAPEAVKSLWRYVDNLSHESDERAKNNEDDRSVGVGQLLHHMTGALCILEAGDGRYDYRRREQIANEAGDSIAHNDAEGVLATLLKYIKPEGINPEDIQGALFKPVVIEDQDGNCLFSEWQPADSFWFKPPFDERRPDEQIELFPNNPQIIDHTGPKRGSLNKTLRSYSDPSYFRPGGTKAYWGDLSEEDIGIIQGAYYCVSQRESYHDVPEWAIVSESVCNDDPNRPEKSYLNTRGWKAFQPNHPVILQPDYIRAVAVGAIVNGEFIPNKRRIELNFVPA